MKNIKNIFAGILIILLNFSIVGATGFPEEPMVIYGNIEGVTNGVLNIKNSNGNLLKTIDIVNGKYGTNKTFDIQNKILLNNFDGNLDFNISGYTKENITKGETNYCNATPIFQAGNICQYNLTFSRISSSGGGGSSSSNNTITSSDDESSNDESSDDESSDRIITKYSDIKIESRDYALGLKAFVKNKKEIKNIGLLKVINIKGDDEYNLVIDGLIKKLNKEVTLLSIKKEMTKLIDKMSTSYGISTDDELDKNIKEKFKQKYILDAQKLEKSFKAAKIKDYIINKALEKRKLKEKTTKKIIETKKEVVKEDSITYSIAVGSIKLSIDNEFKNSYGVLYFGEKLEQISRTKYVVKVKVINSKDGHTGKIGYISRKYLRELK